MADLSSFNLTPEQRQVVDAKKAEALAEAATAYEKLDINGDGNIDRDELKAHAAQAGAAFGGLTGGNGANAEEEIAAFFSTFDADGNGLVSK